MLHSIVSIIFVWPVVFVLALYIWLKYKYSYWQRQNIPYVKPLPLFGNLKNLLLLRISFGELFQQLYSYSTESEAPIVGIYILHRPALVIRDPELIKLILIKHFDMFLNRYEAADPCHDVLGSLALPLAKYPIWRECRKRMSDFFTSGKLRRRMYPLMLTVSRELERYMERSFHSHADEAVIIEAKEMCALFTTDLIAMLAFSGLANGLKNGETVWRKQCCDLFKPSFKKALYFFTMFFLPDLTSLIRAKAFSRDFVDFIRHEANASLKQRMSQKNTQVDDLLDILLRLREYSFETGEHQFAQHSDFIVSQMAIFLLAGFETSSSSIAFTLYELAKQPPIQSRLRSELKQCLQMGSSGEITFDQLAKMTYLNAVVAEALRLYPAAAFINRECTPSAGKTGFSMKPFVDFVVPKGMPAYISILGLHRDPKYWPNPNHFDPERFFPDKIPCIHPMTYIPFGAGPHGCIGSRLGLLQIKLGLVHILKNYRVEPCPRTVARIQFDPKSFMLQAKGGIYLKFVRDQLVVENN